MTVLVDTQALLWFTSGDGRLGPMGRATILESPALAVSEASLWEISIKISVGKLAPMPNFTRVLHDLGLERLRIEDRYLARLETLPLHHRDPFDRMLVAQALADDLTLLTADRELARYGVRIVDARR